MSTTPVMRLRRPRWKDPRLIIGVVLVLASVLLGGLLAARISGTTTVLAAREPIVPGQQITAEDLIAVEVRLGDSAGAYLESAADIPAGTVATRTVDSGELLPRSVLGQPESVPLRPLMIPVDSSIAQSIRPGSDVELWHTPEGDAESSGTEAVVLVDRAVVRRVDEGSSLGMRSMAVEVLIPREKLPEVLQVLAAKGRLDVIGIPGAGEASS